MDIDKFENIVQECKNVNSFTTLIRIIGQVFGSPESLSISFLKHPKAIITDGTDTGLDIIAVRKFYSVMDTMPENVQSVLSNALYRLIEGLKFEAASVSRNSLRKFILMLEHPKLLDEKYYPRFTGQLYSAIVGLPPLAQQFLKENYIFKLENSRIVEFHSVLQNYIVIRVLESSTKLILNEDAGITSATKLLAWVWEINKKLAILPLSHFYNEMINERIDLRIDFSNWIKPTRSSKFTFCHYPFVLNPEIKSKILNIEAYLSKKQKTQEAIQMLHQGVLNIPYVIITVRRDHLIEDSINMISAIILNDPSDLKKKLRVHFDGEQGIDEGGLQKEWFQLIVEDLFSVKYGMYIQDNETRTYWLNHKSEDIEEFALLGNVVALAIYNGVILDLHFPLIVYKKLCGAKAKLEDLAELNPGLYRGMKQLLDYNGENFQEDMDITFQITTNYFGTLETHDLKPGGSEIPVTLENRKEFVDLYVDFLMESSVSVQFEAFKKGFLSVCDGNALKLFEPEELQLLVCGDPVLDFYELEKATSYDNGYSRESDTVKHFWEVVHALTETEKKKLLFFATGSDRSPIGGLGRLDFVVARHGGDTDRLPTAHTCFNHLLLPDYKNKDKLETLLKKAITNSTGFGML
jgi:ubiquitin-protein ligase E3 A